jgi:hypothetical protein
MNKRHVSLILCTLLGVFIAPISFANEDNISSWGDAVTETEDRGKSVLIIPMSGQTLTDIRAEVYADIQEDIETLNPDLIVIEINCKDAKDIFYTQMRWYDPKETDLIAPMAENLPEIAKVFRLHLKDIEQIAFVKDSIGAITPLTLSWEKIYMTPTARLTGTTKLAQRYLGISDLNVRGKMRTAWTNMGSILGGYGKRDPDLTLAFVDPEKRLSGTWNGKHVDWFNHHLGDFSINPYQIFVSGIPATLAEELGISKATVDSLNDVLLLNDIREYHIVGEEITNELNDYVKSWRKNLVKAKDLWGDYRQQSGWATGTQRMRWLVKNKNTIKSLIGVCKKYPAVRIRMGFDDKLKILHDILEEIERELRRPSAPTRDGGGGPSMGGGGGGMNR